jgi:tRNA(fMet)-specific endonuclease VapC
VSDNALRRVVDTDVLSFLFKQDTRAQLYLPYLAQGELLLSFITVAELEQWAEERAWGEVRRQALAAYLAQFTVIHSSPELCRRWAWVRAECRRKRRPIQHADAWIAATALHHGAGLITHNPSDYAGMPGLALLSVSP